MAASSTIRGAAAIVLLVGAAAGCDSNAKATDSSGGRAAAVSSREYETCAATADCEQGLRCVEATCRSAASVVVGDYHAAVGEKALVAGDLELAARSYAEAGNVYKAAGVDPPIWLDCAQGHALTAARQNGDYAELAAHVLHRCVNAAPVGSTLRRRALADLAILGDLGLDPLLLAQQSADLYLTKAPRKPATDSVKVTVTNDGKASGGAWEQLATAIVGARESLLPCWSEHQKSGSLAVPLRFRNRWVTGEYEDSDRYKLSLEATPPGAASAAAQKCVADALAGLVNDFKSRGGGFDTIATVTLAP